MYYEHRTVEKLINLISTNYKWKDPLQILNDQEKSMLFIGTTTSNFKKYIIGDEVNKIDKYFTIQSCLKTHNLKAYEEKKSLSLLSYFHMLGTFEVGPVERKHIKLLKAILINILKLDPEKIVLIVSNYRHKKTVDHTFKGIIKCIINSSLTKYTYGIEGVSGESILIYIRDVNGKYHLIGDLIEVVNIRTRKCFTELCFGLNSINHILSKNHSILHSSITMKLIEKYDFEMDFYTEVFLDAFAASLEIVRTDYKNMSNNQLRILKKYIKYLIITNEYLELDIKKFCTDYLKFNYGFDTKKDDFDLVGNEFNKLYLSQQEIVKVNESKFKNYISKHGKESAIMNAKSKLGISNLQLSKYI